MPDPNVGNDALLREVESLLECSSQAKDFIERSAFGAWARLITNEPDSLEGNESANIN